MKLEAAWVFLFSICSSSFWQSSFVVPLTLFVAALALRAKFNNAESYSPADETTYVSTMQRFIAPGVPWKTLPAELAQEFLRTKSPHPYRYAWYALGALFCKATGGQVTHRKLAWVSTATSALGVPVAYLLAMRWGLPALPAALLVMTSPIAMAMGRRALQDGTLGTLTVLAFLAASTGRWWWTGAALMALLFVKEVSLLGWGGYAVVYLFASHGDWLGGLAAFGVPPVVFLGVSLAVLNLRPGDLLTIQSHLTRHEGDAYAMGYGRGPWHAYTQEFSLLSPLVAILVVRGWQWTPLAIGLAVYAAVWSVLKFKNYRFFTGADIVLRVLATSALVGLGAAWTWSLVAVCMLLDFLMFRRVFLQRGVYDPVPHTVAQALDMAP